MQLARACQLLLDFVPVVNNSRAPKGGICHEKTQGSIGFSCCCLFCADPEIKGPTNMGMIRSVASAMLVGPFISGLAQPAHIMIPSVTARGIFNVSAATSADIQKRKGKH